jgi:hypothetical protein
MSWRFRFRANVILEGAGVPFIEDAWEDVTFKHENGADDASISCVSRMFRCGVRSCLILPSSQH